MTHALSLVGDLFVDKGDMVLLPDKFWENYELLFGVRSRPSSALFPFFNAAGGFNVEALRQALATRAGSWKTILILNFPNNPTGYSITQGRGRPDRRRCCWRRPTRAATWSSSADDAYFGLFYGDDVLQESLFARLAGIHERILAVKVDGPTKEEFVWGFRTGMLTFAAAGLLQQRSPLPGLGKEGRRRHPQRRVELLAPRANRSWSRRSPGTNRPSARRRSRFSRSGRRRSSEILAGRNTPSIGSRIPSTPATSCA